MSAYQDLLDVLDYAPGDRPYDLLQEVLMSGFGGSSDCIVASKIPGIHLDSDLETGGGTDDTELLQAALDTPTIKELVIDGVALVSGLKIHSNTKITILPGCGLFQAPRAANGSVQAATAINTTTNVITCAGHGLVDGDHIVFDTVVTSTGILTTGKVYYVRDKATDTFKISAHPLGTAVDITGSNGTGTFHKVATMTPLLYTSNCVIPLNASRAYDAAGTPTALWGNVMGAPTADGTYDAGAAHGGPFDYVAYPEPSQVENIQIVGGTFNCNSANRVTTTTATGENSEWTSYGHYADLSSAPLGILILNAKNVRLEGVTIRTSRWYHILCNAVQDLVVQDVTVDDAAFDVAGYQDALDIWGPSKNITIRNLTCRCIGDDWLQLCPRILPWTETGMTAGGDISNVHVDGVTMRPTLTRLYNPANNRLAMLRDATQRVDNCWFRNLDIDHQATIASDYTGLNPRDTFFETRGMSLRDVGGETTVQAWVTATQYAPGDLVSASSKYYVCVAPHQASYVFSNDTNLNRWLEITWANARAYVAGNYHVDPATGKLYRCDTACTSDNATFLSDTSVANFTEVTLPVTLLANGWSSYAEVCLAMQAAPVRSGSGAQAAVEQTTWWSWRHLLHGMSDPKDIPLVCVDAAASPANASSPTDAGSQGCHPIRTGIWFDGPSGGTYDANDVNVRGMLSGLCAKLPGGNGTTGGNVERTIALDVLIPSSFTNPGYVFQYGDWAASKSIAVRVAPSAVIVAGYSKTPTVTRDTWHRLIATFDGTETWKAWLDGVALGTSTGHTLNTAVTFAAGPTNYRGNYTIGGIVNGIGFKGAVRNVRVWSVAVSDANAEAYGLDFANPDTTPPTSASLVLNLPMNDYDSLFA